MEALEDQTLIPLAVFLLVWAALYILGGRYGKRTERLEFVVKPFFLQFKVREINRFIDRLSAHKFSYALKLISPPIATLLSATALAFLANNLYNFFVQPPKFTGVTVLIPFITVQNITLLTFFFLSIPVILIPHELAHAIVARLEGINLKSGGFALLGLLLAGFIEPDEEQFKRANPKKRARVLAAGSTANLIVAAIFFSLILFQPVTAIYMPDALRDTFYGPPSGIYVYIVDEARGIGSVGVKPGDIIKEVNGVPVNSLEEFFKLGLKPGDEVEVVVDRGGELLTFTTIAIGEGEKGRLGFYGFTYYPPYIRVSPMPPMVFGFLYWVAFFSLMVGMFNMLPLYPFDGDGFFSSIFEIIGGKKMAAFARIGLNAFSITLFGGNLVATVVKMGFIVL